MTPRNRDGSFTHTHGVMHLFPMGVKKVNCGVSVVSQKMVGYCWPTSFNVLGVLFRGEVPSAFLPSKKACWAHQFRYVGGWPTVSARFVDIGPATVNGRK